MLTTLLLLGALMLTGLFLNRSIKPNVDSVLLRAPIADTGITTPAIWLDLQGFDSAMIDILVGALTVAGNLTYTMVESDVASGNGTTVDPSQVDWSGTVGPGNVNPTAAGAAANTVYRAGYLGGKRYIAMVSTLNSGTSAIVGMTGHRGNASQAPLV